MKFEFEISDDEIVRIVHDELKKAVAFAVTSRARSYFAEQEIETRINELWPASVDASIEKAFAALQAKDDESIERKMIARIERGQFFTTK
ncbi:MAG: hypothetical protein ACYCXC_00050 [Acidovorax defluvii]